jgi:hypothetical protein
MSKSMAHLDIEVANHRPCSDIDQIAAGAYFANLHRWGPRGLEHHHIQLGARNINSVSIGSLMGVLLQITEERSNPYKKKSDIPFNRLVGMTVVRACIHPQESQGGQNYKSLIAEPMERYAFVPDLDHIYPADYGSSGPRISPNGVSTHVFTRLAGETNFITAQHLLVTPHEEESFPVSHVVPSLATAAKPQDAWVALRAIPSETRFVETLVSREELLDTAQL